MNRDLLNYFEDILGKENVRENENMSGHTSFKAGGCVDVLMTPPTEDSLVKTIQKLEDAKCEYMILGNGSNLLFKDGGYRGAVVKICGEGFSGIEVEGTTVTAGAAALLSSIAQTALKNELTGFEFASGIPGSAGGALFMNAGAYGGEMAQIVKSAQVLNSRTGEVKTVLPDEMDLSYRHSAFMGQPAVILSITYELAKGNREEISGTMKALAAKRNSKQPVNYPSAGSFFKRPEGYFAGKLVQDAGLKGLSCGGAQVSELHSGFIINRDNATATDIVELMKVVQNTVYDKFGVMMEPEVRIIGEDRKED